MQRWAELVCPDPELSQGLHPGSLFPGPSTSRQKGPWVVTHLSVLPSKHAGSDHLSLPLPPPRPSFTFSLASLLHLCLPEPALNVRILSKSARQSHSSPLAHRPDLAAQSLPPGPYLLLQPPRPWCQPHQSFPLFEHFSLSLPKNHHTARPPVWVIPSSSYPGSLLMSFWLLLSYHLIGHSLLSHSV